MKAPRRSPAKVQAKPAPRAALPEVQHAEGGINVSPFRDVLDLAAPAGRYCVDELLDDWPAPIHGRDKLRALRQAASATKQSALVIVGPLRLLQNRGEAAKTMQKLMSNADRAARALMSGPVDIAAGGFGSGTDWGDLTEGYDLNDIRHDIYSQQREQLAAIVSLAKDLSDAISLFGLERQVSSVSLGRSKPVEREFARWCKSILHMNFGVEPSASRDGPFVRFARAAWRDTGMPELPGIDDTLATYCGLSE